MINLNSRSARVGRISKRWKRRKQFRATANRRRTMRTSQTKTGPGETTVGANLLTTDGY